VSSACYFWELYFELTSSVAAWPHIEVVGFRHMHKINVKNTVFSAYVMEACRGSRGIDPLVLNLGIRWRKTFRERIPGTK
jgi:hypothetical protein